MINELKTDLNIMFIIFPFPNLFSAYVVSNSIQIPLTLIILLN